MDKAKSILKHTFGYSNFRPLQENIIKNVLDKKDSLVIMPTGGGKSLCYQVPSLIFDGLTIVISPLISLMKDQVAQLRQFGIPCAVLNSGLSRKDYNQNYTSVGNGTAKLLYLAPESLAREEVAALISNVKLSCITVDEAHCISEWGHDFRPEYRQLGAFRKKYPDAVCLALTATATPRVQDDIIKNLNMLNGEKFLASFNRDNLYLQVVFKRNPLEQAVDFLKEHPGQSGIIYCFSRKQVEELHEDLSAMGFSTKPYHAGLSDEERNKNQELFIKDEVQVIIATIAFGMGINKSNVRFVLHYDLPKNLESYYQEIGRSGRDGLKADCLLLFSYADIAKINYFIDLKENPTERLSAKAHLDAMVKYAEAEVCRRVPLINYFGEKYDVNTCSMCDNCLADDKELTDITIPAQKFLSAVKRTNEIFGALHIIDVLLGAETEKIKYHGHQKLTVYGIGTEYDKKQWQYISRQLVNKQLLMKDVEFGSLKLTEKAYNVLLRNEKVYGLLKEEEKKIKKAESAEVEYDKELFDILTKKRKQIADLQDIPPYVIFSDKSLVQMAIEMPVNAQAFARISGVSENKLVRYGGAFITEIKSYCRRKNITPKLIFKRTRLGKIKEKPRHRVVAEAFNSGVTIEKLAEEYDVKMTTILSHLERYANEGGSIQVKELYSRITVSKDIQSNVFYDLRHAEGPALKPIFDKYEGKISYDELHVLRILFRSKFKL
jgi:ATP-dependent DNA helicase RecQ